jgi:4-hydroxythreonine-4-phosphate dehydrogenase
MTESKPIIGITLGDYNGIGPEVILKALQGNHFNKVCTPVIYGSMRILNRYKHLLDMKDWHLFGVQDVSNLNPKATNILTCWAEGQTEVEAGKVTAEAGLAAFLCLQKATDDLKDGKIDAIVTAPINKHNIQSESFKFPGHTEFFTESFGATDSLMFLVSEQLRVGVVTGHIPLGSVNTTITQDAIAKKLTLMLNSLKKDFGISKPRIAVLGLNPHAGEEGLLGNEEIDILKPVINQFKHKGNLIFGPFPADGFFGRLDYQKFDAVLAMYHDQGLVPFKLLAFENGVNFTAGLPIVRTSPDHGTAYDIAGKGIANESSLKQAIFTALDVLKNRKEA